MSQFTTDSATRSAIDNLAASFGVDPGKAHAASASIFDTLTTSMARAASSRGGLADLVEILGAPGREPYLQPGTPLHAPEVTSDGIGILSQLLGSRDKSRAVAARAATASGLDADTVKAMLPSVAAVAVSAIAKQTQGALGDILKIPGLGEVAREARDDIGGGGQLAPPQYGSPLPLPGEPPRRYSPSPNTDWTASTGRRPQAPTAPAEPAPRPSGNTGMRDQSPLPVPGDDVPGMGRHADNPYGDLSDILRRGGFRLPGGFRIPGGDAAPRPSGGGRNLPVPDEGSVGAGGGLLANIIRSILGSVLGGGTGRGGGLISWIIRLIVLRYGTRILGTILRRIGLPV